MGELLGAGEIVGMKDNDGVSEGVAVGLPVGAVEVVGDSDGLPVG